MALEIYLETLLKNLIEESVPKKLLVFLGKISHDRQIPPQNFFFLYELERLNFDSFARFKFMNKYVIQMISMGFIFIRILLYEIILQPWNHDNSLINSKEKHLMYKKNNFYL